MSDRYNRFASIIPIEKMQLSNITIVGVGAIGRQVAIQLCAMGVKNIQIIDHDKVSTENLGSQGFFESDLESNKVDAIKNICKSINSEVNIYNVNSKFNPIMFSNGILFCCVDSIDTRKSIFNRTKSKFDLFIDGRMTAEYLKVFTINQTDESKKFYEENLFPSNEAHTGSCTSKTTLYCATMAASIMVSQFAKWIRGIDCSPVINMNILTEEMDTKKVVSI